MIEQKLRSREGDAKAQTEFAALQREALTANPLVSGQPILFVVRRQYQPGHHNTETFFPAAQHEYNTGAFTPGGAMKTIDFARGGVVKTLIELPDGVVRDPEVHFSGQKIIFSMRKNAGDSYHIYEINADGSGLRQLTFAKDVDDLDPLYLPDGSIVFSSTREPKYCMCNRHIMANLYRMEADGANIHQIGKSTLFEGHGALMPDGRILYDRWEYVDRNFGDAQGLWTVNPDGTGHAVYWGNNTGSPGGVLDARPIPGTERVMCTFTSCHDRPWGAIAIVDRALGLDGSNAVVRIWPADARRLVNIKGGFDDFRAVHPKYEDPYPLSDKYFLCSRMTGREEQMGIYLLDVFGNEILLHAENKAGSRLVFGCYDPMPLAPRPRPAVVPSRRDFGHREGYFYVQDVYIGTHMTGVKRGAVKSLRVVESPEKRFWTLPAWGGQGIEAPAMNWHDFNNKRILGTVPVEADGSAYFAAPSDTFVYFQLLDENGMMVQSMRSGTIAQSGEITACVGCHEERRHAPPAVGHTPLALRRAPSRLEGWHGPPRLFNYIAEVQPVFTRRCLPCHDFGGQAAHKLILAPDRDLVFNASYNELWRKRYIRVVGAGPAETQPAYSWGSHASRLIETMRKCQKRYGTTAEELDRVITWVDLNAPYYPTYASAYPDNLAGRSPLDNRQLARLEYLTGVPLSKLAEHTRPLGPQISFERPELSPCLQKFADKSDPKYQEALAIIRAGQHQLAQRPDADSLSFQPCSLDQWREQKYVARRVAEERNREAIRMGRKMYDTSSQ
ncbi:MAG: hypothetical protein N2689_06515 [Verrucomicrobiae bacterium]|nr:hypothetical protein [Verrucomicrobiae bacterium]